MVLSNSYTPGKAGGMIYEPPKVGCIYLNSLS